MLYCDKLFNKGKEENQVTEKRAFSIGLFQCLSVIPWHKPIYGYYRWRYGKRIDT